MNTRTLTEQQLVEGLGEDVLKTLRKAGFGTHLFLDIVGVVGDLIPGAQLVGIASDVANAILYLVKDPPQYLNAGLSLLSAIPGIGDVLGKGGKVAKSFSKVIKSAMPLEKGAAMSPVVARGLATALPKGAGGGAKMYKKLRTPSTLTYKLGVRLKNVLPNLDGLLKELGKKHPIFLEARKLVLDEVEEFAETLIVPNEQEPAQIETNKVEPVEPVEPEALNEQRNRMLVLAGIPRK